MVLLITMISSAAADDVQSEGNRALTLRRFLELASGNDTKFQEILVDELTLAYTKKRDLPSRDIVFSSAARYDLSMEPEGNSGPNATVALSKLFPGTGTSVKGEYTAYPSRYTEGMIYSYTAEISQPIAKNAFGKAYRLQEQLVGLENDIARYQVVEAYEDYFASLIVLYYDWYTAHKNLITARLSYGENERLLQNIIARQRMRIAQQVDVDKIRLQVIEKRENVLSMERQYRQKLTLICGSIGYRGTHDLEPVMDGNFGRRKFAFGDRYTRFLNESRTMRVLKLLDEKSKKTVENYADALLPSANMILGYSRQGLDSRFGNKGVNRIVYGGVTLEFPFGQQQDRAIYEISRIDARKTRYQAMSKKTQLESDLKNIYNEITVQRKLIEIAQKKVDVAQRLVMGERKNYLQARTSLTDYIKVINDLENARFQLTSRVVTLNTLVVEWLRLTDSLVVRRDIKTRHGAVPSR